MIAAESSAQQQHGFEDYTEASLMFQYSKILLYDVMNFESIIRNNGQG